MKITVIGAAGGEVIGSAYVVQTREARVLVDCGLFQGGKGAEARNHLPVRARSRLDTADIVFLESTYGNRDHRPFRGTVDEFVEIITAAAATRSKILIPTFAVGRAQLLVTLLSLMFRKQKVKPFPIFLDSPMAIEATRIYSRHPELFDEEMRKYIREKPLREDLKTLTPCVTAEQSKAINQCPGPCLVMAGAGMCNAGRILHHLKQNLWKPETFVLMVGYQAHGTLGRQLVDGATHVNIFGEKIAVQATVRTLGGFSAHAGQTDLLGWVDAIAPSKPLMVLTHGEDPQRRSLAQCIKKQYRLRTLLPMQGDTIEV